jgi:Fe-S-cluster containining protein
MQERQKEIFKQLENLYLEMDRAWEAVAILYGFQCNGCDENCCETEFFHHTLVEKAYLLKGVNELLPPKIIAAKKRAKKVVTKRAIASKRGESIRIMCPLNEEQKCIIYKFRPMICRLHGIPHELLKPTYSNPTNIALSSGCKAGAELFDKIGYIKFDRTPFYLKMAEIEKEYLNRVVGKFVRNKETIAQMLSD